MKYQITDLIDIDKINTLMENFSEATGIAIAILDLNGNVLSGTGWKEICTQFHRENPQTAKRCTESDTVLASMLEKGEKYNLYKCLNGLVDVAVPIVINGEQIGNFFTGQFFLEPPDEDFFRKQALDYDFDEVSYLEALSKVPIISEDKVKQTMSFLVDLTEFIGEMGLSNIKQFETTNLLKKSEERYRAIAEDTPILICRFLPGYEISYVNETYCNYFSKTKEDLVGTNFLSLILETDREAVMVSISSLTSDSPVATHDERIITLQGEIRWQRWINRGLFDMEGQIISYQAIGEDITERKRAEETLKKRTHDLGERVKELNCLYGIASLVEKQSISLEEIIQGTITLIPPAWQYPEITCGRIRLEGREYLTENFQETTWEQTQDITVSGETVGSIEVYYLQENPEIDEGPFLKDERSLINAIAERLGRVIERMRHEEEKEKLEDLLRQAHKMEAIGTLAGGIAHEFNNILGIIVGNTELAMGGIPEWNTAHYNLEEIQKGSLRARDIVKQILAFSRQTKHELKPVKICSLIDESIKFIRSSIPTTVEIKKDISAESDTINADPTQINQILLNLCNNAAHAMQHKGGVLEISLENVELNEKTVRSYEDLNPGNHVKLTVSDTGYGIEKENLEHIFDPFFTTKEVGKGTGMGLSVVHGIVKEHNGSIMVQSETGKGTAFHVLFPVIESSVKPELDSKEPLLKGSERILFVDDEESLVLAAKKNLEDMGYEVVTKRSPVKALEMFKEQPDEFDLVITDMAMPDLPGDRFAAEIMKIRRDVPVIACTGYSDRMDGELAEEMGIRAYIMKPYLASELATIIRLALDQGKEEKTHEKGKILVVDDEEQMRSIIRQMLESAGYDVMEAPDGKVALWLFKERPADLIITDIIVPEKEGLETIMELKRELPDVKIIAISGGGQGDAGQYLDMAKKMGANSTLAKPFEKEELLKAVKDLLG